MTKTTNDYLSCLNTIVLKKFFNWFLNLNLKLQNKTKNINKLQLFSFKKFMLWIVYFSILKNKIN